MSQAIDANSYLKHFLLHTSPSSASSFLSLAIHAVALAVFGQQKINSVASAAAIEKYGRALSKTNLAIGDPEQATSDQVLVTIMLLHSYEVGTVQHTPPSLQYQYRKSMISRSALVHDSLVSPGPYVCLISFSK
jgi:hypothetical protein